MSRRAARLEVIAGKAVGMSIPVEEELLLGREFEGPGKLADDDEISRRHARISFTDASGEFTVEDLGSTNGTFVNGTRIAEPRPLVVGDTIELGSTTLIVRELPGRGEDTVIRPDGATVGPGTPSQPPAEEAIAQPSSASLVISPAGLGAKEETLSDEPATPLRGGEVAEQPTSIVVPDSPVSGTDVAEQQGPIPLPASPVADSPIAGQRASIAVPGSLRLQLEVDFAARSAKVTLGEGEQAVALVFEQGVWRVPEQSR